MGLVKKHGYNVLMVMFWTPVFTWIIAGLLVGLVGLVSPPTSHWLFAWVVNEWTTAITIALVCPALLIAGSKQILANDAAIGGVVQVIIALVLGGLKVWFIFG